MKTMLEKNRRLWIWLGFLLGILLLFLLLRGRRDLMTWVAEEVMQPLKDGVGSLCALAPVPVIEVLYLAAAAGGVVYIGAAAVKIIRSPGRRRAIAGRRGLLLLCVLLTVLDWFCLVWGINYYADGFQEKSGLSAREMSAGEIYQLTEHFTRQLNAASKEVPRDKSGRFSVSREEIFAQSTEIYPCIYTEFPFLAREDRQPKQMMLPQLLSAMGFTGFYAGFTGESVLNGDSPEAFLPATIVHELTHQRGIASEQECNFLAVVVSTRSGNSTYRYSGYLMGYIHLSNALYKADPEGWQELRAQLDPGVLADIRYNNAYWARWESPVDKVSQKVYDTMLKGYGQKDGVQSYGTMVDLLAAYYLPLEEPA